MRGPPPLYRDTLAFSGVLLEEIEAGDNQAGLRRRLAAGALRLVDDITLALNDFDRWERLQAADAELRTLRTHLLLALELRVLEEEIFLALAEQADRVGRQLGGWLKKLARHRDAAG